MDNYFINLGKLHLKEAMGIRLETWIIFFYIVLKLSK